MTRESGIQKELHYYSEKLTQKLSQLRSAAAAVVEAPSGYGKTTAVRDFLEASVPQGTGVFWFTAADEAPEENFRRLCLALAKIDGRAGGRMRSAGFPGAANLGEICDALRSVACCGEAWLIVDNFQLLDRLPASFLRCLLVHGSEGLHIVAITQFLQRDLLAFIHRHGIMHVTQSDLNLSAEDIRSYYRLAGEKISEQDAKYVEHNTGGWIAAVYLHLRALRERGAFLDAPGILALMEQLVWDALDDTRRMFLLRISPFEAVTQRQADALCGDLPQDAWLALQLPFIRFDPMEQRHELHGLLAELLCKKRRECGAAFERECFARAGDLCRDEGQSLRAIEFYSRAEDFGRILSLDLCAFYTETIGEIPFYKLALRIAQSCPPDILRVHPLSMLQAAYVLLAAGKEEEFSALLDSLRPLLDGGDEETVLLLADWTLLSSYRFLPDIAKMTGMLKRSAELFGGRRSRVIFPDSPWCYSVMGPFMVFHTTAGGAEREAEALEEYFALYTGITGGHGAGADILFRMEYAYYSGNFSEAEILAHKAAFVAQNSGQEGICMMVTFYLAWLAAQKRDSAGWRSAFATLTGNFRDLFRRCFVLSTTRDTAQAILLEELGMEDELKPRWLREGDFSGEHLPHFAPPSIIVYLDSLRNQKSFSRLLGTVNALYPQGLEVRRYSDVYIALLAASGCVELGLREQAAELICRAALFALSDGVYLQLVVYNGLTKGLVEECLLRDFPAHVEPFCRVQKNIGHALTSIFPDFSEDELPQSLTEREREVALLAASGLTNEEIAGRLTLTASTVRTHLRSVFRKLDIDRRTKLVEKLR